MWPLRPTYSIDTYGNPTSLQSNGFPIPLSNWSAAWRNDLPTWKAAINRVMVGSGRGRILFLGDSTNVS